MLRGEFLLPLAGLALLSAIVALFSQTSPHPKSAPHVVVPSVGGPDTSAPAAQQFVPINVVADPKFSARKLSATVPEIADAAASPSSWENPFSPELWESTGWTFAYKSMRATGPGPSSATFRRHYQKLMFECDILAAEAPGSTWKLQLTTRNSQVVMSIVLHDGRLSVLTIENGLTRLVVEKPLTAPLSPQTARHIRVVATGNRIVVSWDRKRFLTTEQLASQSGHEIAWSIYSSGAEYQISRLRVEGD